MPDFDDIKQHLVNRLAELESRVTAINKDISHLEQPLSNDWSEQAIERENDEVLEALGNASQRELFQIRNAIQRINSGTYQICEHCSKTIPLKRLELVPHTSLCTNCAEAQESH